MKDDLIDNLIYLTRTRKILWYEDRALVSRYICYIGLKTRIIISYCPEFCSVFIRHGDIDFCDLANESQELNVMELGEIVSENARKYQFPSEIAHLLEVASRLKCNPYSLDIINKLLYDTSKMKISWYGKSFYFKCYLDSELGISLHYEEWNTNNELCLMISYRECVRRLGFVPIVYLYQLAQEIKKCALPYPELLKRDALLLMVKEYVDDIMDKISRRESDFTSGLIERIVL